MRYLLLPLALLVGCATSADQTVNALEGRLYKLETTPPPALPTVWQCVPYEPGVQLTPDNVDGW